MEQAAGVKTHKAKKADPIPGPLFLLLLCKKRAKMFC